MTTPTTDAATTDSLRIEFLYLDLSHCGRCQGTRAALTAAIEATRAPLEYLGKRIERHDRHIASIAEAEDADFRLSPTVRIDGRDLQPDGARSRCKECGDLCNCAGGMDCRAWEWRGVTTATPPVGLFVEAILAAVAGSAAIARRAADAPEGPSPEIQAFFGGRDRKEGCCETNRCV